MSSYSAYSILSFLSQGDAAVTFEVSETGVEGISEVILTLYGNYDSTLDISFEYRSFESEDWRNDAVIISGQEKDGNILKGLNCSTSGEKHIVYWNHKANGFVDGQELFIKASIVFSPLVFLSSPIGTFGERISTHKAEFNIEHRNVVNKDRSGNIICIENDEVWIVNESGTSVISGFDSPTFCLQKPDGNFLVLDAGNKRIVEIGDDYSTIIRIFDITLFTSNSRHMAYDDEIQTILLSGGTTPRIYEFTWGDGDYGSLLWSHGDVVSGSGINQLNWPYGVCYGSDKSIIYVADYGNNRVVKIDRKTTTPEIINSIQIGSVVVAVNFPKFVQSTGDDSVYIVEGQGEQELYSTNKNQHPALKRFFNNNPNNETDKDGLPEYNNLLFNPLLNSIFRNAGWDTSSSSSFNSSSSSSRSSISSSSSISSASSLSSQSSSQSSSSQSSPSSQSSSSSIEQSKIIISGQGFNSVPEWIEVKNTGAYSRNMTGWYIISHEQPPPCLPATPIQRYRFPIGFVLAGGATVRIYSGPGSSSANNNPPSSLWWGVGSRWNDTGDIGDLYNHQGILISNIASGNCL